MGPPCPRPPPGPRAEQASSRCSLFFSPLSQATPASFTWAVMPSIMDTASTSVTCTTNRSCKHSQHRRQHPGGPHPGLCTQAAAQDAGRQNAQGHHGRSARQGEVFGPRACWTQGQVRPQEGGSANSQTKSALSRSHHTGPSVSLPEWQSRSSTICLNFSFVTSRSKTYPETLPALQAVWATLSPWVHWLCCLPLSPPLHPADFLGVPGQPLPHPITGWGPRGPWGLAAAPWAPAT